MRVLVACERSGVVRDAFLRRGHDAYSCDVNAGNGDRHLRQDVTPLLKQPWDLVIVHPPCTYLSKVAAGARRKDFICRQLKMLDAVEFFLKCYNCNSPRVAVENPIMFLDARARIGIEPTQKICPSMFGHNRTKTTYLWLRGLPALVATNQVDVKLTGIPGQRDHTARVFDMQQSAILRSITATGIAEAMATQWGDQL